MRIGVGHPGDKNMVMPHVLNDFAKDDRAWLDPLIAAIADEFPLLVAGEDAKFQSKVHLAVNPAREKTDKTGDGVMGFKCGIVGLPNVGKSTLFNALTQTAAAQAANYPFCTIEPNVGDVGVPDTRLDALAEIAGSAQIIPTRLTFVDIAGLVRGASKGEGLGNQFLANIREVDAIAHVVRCFEDTDITHVEGKIDPVADIETIETELMLADLDSLEKRALAPREARQGRRQGHRRSSSISSIAALCCCAKASRRALSSAAPEEERNFRMLGLLSSKPVLYVCNVEEASADKGNAFSDKVKVRAAEEGAQGGGDLGQDRKRDRRFAGSRSPRLSRRRRA